MKDATPSMYPPAMDREDVPEVAIVGGGIIGLTLALGLNKRGINAKVYEQARSLREIGAGVAFTANAVRCMEQIDPRLVTALRSVATSNGDPNNPNDHLQWVDGFNVDPEHPEDEELLYKLYAGPRGFEGCHRAHFLDALLKVVPEGVLQFGKRLANVVEQDEEEKVKLEFEDGTVAEADAVIGCDGIKSRVRELMFGSENPVSHPTYTHKIAYRGLIPMDKAVEAVGESKAKNQHMHLGPQAHLLHFPVANQKLMNVVAFAPDPEEWEDSKTFVAPATRRDVEKVFAGWGTTVRSIVSLLPNDLDKWAVFDSSTFPVPCYNKGRICIAGDAAHAAAPHHGAGAGIGVEDALCLSALLDKAASVIQDDKASKSQALKLAFITFNTIRRKRTQWLVQSSHDVCEIYEWNHPKTGSDPDKCFEEIRRRSHKIWYFDYEDMVRESSESFEWRVVIQALVNGDRKVDLPTLEQMRGGDDSESDSVSDSSIATPTESRPNSPMQGLKLVTGAKAQSIGTVKQDSQIV
ncbi:hypothetical protein PMZ80_004895 [Knufia obscura]|uniref:FAD-binding domain-containing protein n=1 Tax=Knufia obscura TaxID=1635080 RepID=A0ABR0RNZ6_9EURO|nr:hypothetical protein PMZ80_004895 [Knufia obscura]